MKKYLLLASVAGCLLSANAMAATYSGNTATIIAKASLQKMVNITDAEDMNFGTLVVNSAHKPTSITKIASIDSSSAVTRENTNYVVATEGTPYHGGFMFEDDLTIWESAGEHFSIACNVGTYNTNGCELANGDSKLYLQNIGIHQNGTGTYYFSADLYADSTTTAGSTGDAANYSGAFTITLEYE